MYLSKMGVNNVIILLETNIRSPTFRFDDHYRAADAICGMHGENLNGNVLKVCHFPFSILLLCCVVLCCVVLCCVVLCCVVLCGV